MNITKEMLLSWIVAKDYCLQYRHDYILPEHVMHAVLTNAHLVPKLAPLFCVPVNKMVTELEAWFDNLEKVPESVGEYELTMSEGCTQMIYGCQTRKGPATIDNSFSLTNFFHYLFRMSESMANFMLLKYVAVTEAYFFDSISAIDDGDEIITENDNHQNDDEEDDVMTDVDDGPFSPSLADDDGDWHQWVTDISENACHHTPLIGREQELDRTILILCRMEKNNPLHIGEPGVGKTALVYGLAQRINSGTGIPERLQGARIYGMDMGKMVAGTQFRGDFENRMKKVLDGAVDEGNVILYLDEIHQAMGAGRVSTENGPSAIDILKPYLAEGKLRFIGSTTYEDYNRTLANDKSIVRRFQQIDIHEPSVEDTLRIVEGLIPSYQKFHHVTYHREAWKYAVKASHKYITQRRLPDKALDLIDEAGAYLEAHPTPRTRSYVTRSLIQQIMQRVCRIDAAALKEEDNDSLRHMEAHILQQIYGQDEAVKRLVEAVMMAKAGLTDEDKPLASLLFVGPTGVGKTEVARVLAAQLGVELVRFDMSEYAEKHTVAKLIGSPAGYVGYEDGGLLTAAIRRTPNCVLLLDEIEKAHSDIYNVLLQVMDYAKLTDNRGQQADFHQVILVMTSNAGAQYASQSHVGFTGGVSRGAAMKEQVKKTFKPEFINRLSDIVVFHDMDKHMAQQILQKKLHQLDDKLAARQVGTSYTPAAMQQLLRLGFTPEYGAREMDRVIGQHIKPLFMREILFGRLRKGGRAEVDYEGNHFVLHPVKP